MSIVDSIAHIESEIQQYNSLFMEYQTICKRKSDLEQKSKENAKEIEFKQFIAKELDSAKLRLETDSQLENEYEQHEHKVEIITILQSTLADLDYNEISTLQLLHKSKEEIKKIYTFVPELKDIPQRIENCIIELKDICKTLLPISETMTQDPERHSIVKERLDLLNSLMAKYKVSTIEALVELRDKNLKELQTYETYSQEIEQLEKQKEELHIALQKLNTSIYNKRIKECPTIEKAIIQLLTQLGMPHARFKIQISQPSTLRPNAEMDIRFMFSANKNIELQPIEEIASGGEISRFMLCVKHFISQTSTIPTIIFDEIDTGVSGDIAEKMAEMMSTLSKHIQVISITHLPQIAAKGNEHFIVYKDDNGEQSTTNIRKLDKEQRVKEIAKMLSGKEITEAALKNATVLLEQSILN
ncbi:MAG: hypothetical protein SNJ71_05295 [Bacteroidales bacterium]